MPIEPRSPDAASDALAAAATSAAAAVAAVASSRVVVFGTNLRYDGYPIPSRMVQSRRALEVATETSPSHGVTSVDLFWKVGEAVASRAMTAVERDGGPSAPEANARWHATIPAEAFVDGRPIEYWIRATEGAGGVAWDSNDGKNHRIVPHDKVNLFDGTVEGWRMAGNGAFAIERDADGPVMVARPADGLGLYWSTFPTPASYELSIDFRLSDKNDNSGVFLSFPDPERFGYENTAWVGVHYGLEVQIDEIARPDGADLHRTGAIYGWPNQTLSLRGAKIAGLWNRYRIRVIDRMYSVELDGQEVSRLVFTSDPSQPLRALPPTAATPRFVGVQAHTGRVAFRDVRLKLL